jgi:hypothetical protein
MNEGYFYVLSIGFPNAATRETWLRTPLGSGRDALDAARVDLEDSPLLDEGLDLDGAGLLSWARTGGYHVDVRDDPEQMGFSGYLVDFDAWQAVQPLLFLAASTALGAGATAEVAFVAAANQNDGPVWDTLVADAGGLVRSRQYEPQDVSLEQLQALAARFGMDIDASSAAYDVFAARSSGADEA